MAKSKPETYRVEFGDQVFENVKIHLIPMKVGDKHFFHLEKKPNGWLMLSTEGFLDFDNTYYPIDVIRPVNEVRKPLLMVRNGCPCPVSVYTVLTIFHGKEFYHLDELDDHTFRIAHSVKMFAPAFEHINIDQIKFTREA